MNEDDYSEWFKKHKADLREKFILFNYERFVDFTLKEYDGWKDYKK